jgi:hypothetical protein
MIGFDLETLIEVIAKLSLKPVPLIAKLLPQPLKEQRYNNTAITQIISQKFILCKCRLL